jgi:hypothetical protein
MAVFCKNLLYLHIPKTAGMSLTQYLLGVLPRPVYYSHRTVEPPIRGHGIVHVRESPHFTLDEADRIVGTYGFEARAFPVVLVVLRNPYDLEVSGYSYQYAYASHGNAANNWLPGLTRSQVHNLWLARTENFEDFAVHSDYIGASERYFLLDGAQPPNLRVVRFERLDEEVPKVLREAGVEPSGSIPRINVSEHGDWRSYYTRAAERAVYRRNKWVFDNGYYERLDPATFPYRDEAPFVGDLVPLHGPVHQIGPVVGLWIDGWVGDTLRFRLITDAPITSISVEGTLPAVFEKPVPLELAVDGIREHAAFESGPFCLTVCRALPRRSEVTVQLTAWRTWCPREAGVSDDARQLAFILSRVTTVEETGPS